MRKLGIFRQNKGKKTFENFTVVMCPKKCNTALLFVLLSFWNLHIIVFPFSVTDAERKKRKGGGTIFFHKYKKILIYTIFTYASEKILNT